MQHILKREVNRFEEQHILRGTALGELDHPNYASRYFKCLNLPNASHQVRLAPAAPAQPSTALGMGPHPCLGCSAVEAYSKHFELRAHTALLPASAPRNQDTVQA